ncbi:MAG: DinB family protein [Chloroflexota bacterium]
MSALEMIRSYIEYHVDMSRLVWESIGHITEEQFLADDGHFRGSIRDHMLYIISTDRRWLAALKNQADMGPLNAQDYPTREAACAFFESVSKDMENYIRWLGEPELESRAKDMPWPRWSIILHLINHGTHHRAIVLQRLADFGAPVFDQDFLLWLRRQ